MFGKGQADILIAKLYNKMYIVSAPALVLLSSITVSVLCVGGYFYVYRGLSGQIFLFSVLLSIELGKSPTDTDQPAF